MTLRLPLGPVVYRLEHPASGFVYVGATLRPGRRCDEWFRTFREWDAGIRRTSWPSAFRLALSQVGTSDWDFVVVERFSAPPDFDGDAMWRAECAEIERVRHLPGCRSMNRVVSGGFRPSYAQRFPARCSPGR